MNKKTPFDIWDCPDLDANNQLTENPTEACFVGLKFSIVTLMNEITPVLTGKHLFDNEMNQFY